MKKALILIILSCLILSFCILKPENNRSDYSLAFVKEIYIDKSSNEDEKDIMNLVGIFPKNNDTITVYQLNTNLTEKAQKFSYWVKNKNNNSIVFKCTESEESIKVVFDKNNTVTVENDVYTLNNEYYKFLKQKILLENSVLDLAYFLKDGYGDYSQSLEPLNKNWRNQKENNTHRIISAKIKNKNFQTDNQFFNYSIHYKYDNKGKLLSILGGNRYNKKYLLENNHFTKWAIENVVNERSNSESILFINKKTLFDSISGNWTQNSTNRTSYFLKYQSVLKYVNVTKRPNRLEEIIQLLNLKKEDFE